MQKGSSSRYSCSFKIWMTYSSRWRLSMCPWFYSWVEPGTLWLTLWLDIWWAAANGHPSANSLPGWWSYILNTRYLELRYNSPPFPAWHLFTTEPSMFITQAGSLVAVWCPVLSAAVVCATRLDVSGSQRAVVPHSGLPVWDPHECKSVCCRHFSHLSRPISHLTVYTFKKQLKTHLFKLV